MAEADAVEQQAVNEEQAHMDSAARAARIREA
jgi:hypothetical protein